ncbi:UNVERIFIED_CONTAM: rpsI [Trichonephila clavipes]
MEYDETLRSELRKAGYVTRDAREVEPPRTEDLRSSPCRRHKTTALAVVKLPPLAYSCVRVLATSPSTTAAWRTSSAARPLAWLFVSLLS